MASMQVRLGTGPATITTIITTPDITVTTEAFGAVIGTKTIGIITEGLSMILAGGDLPVVDTVADFTEDLVTAAVDSTEAGATGTGAVMEMAVAAIADRKLGL